METCQWNYECNYGYVPKNYPVCTQNMHALHFDVSLVNVIKYFKVASNKNNLKSGPP